MLKNLVTNHAKAQQMLADKLCAKVQKYLEAFCRKHKLSFYTSMESWWFKEFVTNYRLDDDYIKGLDSELYNTLTYDLGLENNRVDLGCLLDTYCYVENLG